jgi:nucleotide-binding universal stress UspA family protein
MYQRILVPIDGSPTADRGLDEAIRLAQLTGASVRVLHVLDQLIYVTGFEAGALYSDAALSALRQGGERILAGAKARAAAAGLNVDTLLVECFGGRAARIVVAEADLWNADLIVLGTHGRRGVRRLLLGSDAEEVVRTAKAPVLLVRAAEAASGDEAEERPSALANATA